MNDAVLYLLKVVLCSGVLYAYYLLALRNRIFHQWNRFYLLSATIFSLLFPLVPLPQFYGYTNATAPIPFYEMLSIGGGETEKVLQSAEQFSWSQFFQGLYLVISTWLLFTVCRGLAQLNRLLRKSKVQQLDSILFVPTAHPAAPFSFFNWLFWKDTLPLDTPGGQSIFRHELVHIQQHHSLDKLMVQIILVFFWINPFFWLMRRELHMIHEFIADKKAVGNAGTEALATMMLQSVYGNPYNQLINPFFQQPIKRRLAMLQKTLKAPRNAYLGRILTLPLCALLLFAFSKNNGSNKTNAPIPLDQPITVIIDAGHGGHDAGAAHNGLEEKNITLQLAQMVKRENQNKNIRVVLTRENDQFAELKQRTELAQKEKADIFISLHMDMSDATSGAENVADQKGIEVHLAPKNEASRNRSTLLGSALIQQLSKVYETRPNLLTRSASGVWVLDQNTVPAVLIECGYLSNKNDRDFITKESNQRLIARQIIAAIEAYATAPKTPVQ